MTDTDLKVADLQAAVEAAWEVRDTLTPATEGLPRHAVDAHGLEREAPFELCAPTRV